MIPLKWKLEPISKQDLANPLLEQTVTSPTNPTKLSGSVNAEKSANRVFNQNRRLPITRSDDFLW